MGGLGLKHSNVTFFLKKFDKCFVKDLLNFMYDGACMIVIWFKAVVG
jgi:hypothetical protein